MLGSHFRPMPCPPAQERISAGLVFAGVWGTPGLNVVVLQFPQGHLCITFQFTQHWFCIYSSYKFFKIKLYFKKWLLQNPN